MSTTVEGQPSTGRTEHAGPAPRMAIWALAPESYRAMLALSATVDRLDPVLRELVKIRASQLNGCAFCLDMHTQDARAAGETGQRLYALDAWREAPFFGPRERAALALTEAMTALARGHVPDAVYAAAAHFEPTELATLIWQVTVINAWNRIAVATRMPAGVYRPGDIPATA